MEEVKRLVEILPGEWPDMIRVCLYTGGQRLGDIATLRWEQVNLDGGLIAMTSQKTKRRMNKPIIRPLKEILEEREKYSINEFVFPLAAMKHAQGGGKSSKLSLEFTGLLKNTASFLPGKGKGRETSACCLKKLSQSEGDRGNDFTVGRGAGRLVPIHCRS